MLYKMLYIAQSPFLRHFFKGVSTNSGARHSRNGGSYECTARYLAFARNYRAGLANSTHSGHLRDLVYPRKCLGWLIIDIFIGAHTITPTVTILPCYLFALQVR